MAQIKIDPYALQIMRDPQTGFIADMLHCGDITRYNEKGKVTSIDKKRPIANLSTALELQTKFEQIKSIADGEIRGTEMQSFKDKYVLLGDNPEKTFALINAQAIKISAQLDGAEKENFYTQYPHYRPRVLEQEMRAHYEHKQAHPTPTHREHQIDHK